MIFHFFFTFNLTCCKYIVLEKNTSTFLRVFLMKRSGCRTKGQIWRTKKLSPLVPPLITEQILKKKEFLIAFRQILPKFLPTTCIFSYAVITYLKSSLELNPQFPAGLSLKIIHRIRLLTKNAPSFCFVAPTRWGLSPFPQTFFGNHKDEERIPPSIEKLTNFSDQENPP